MPNRFLLFLMLLPFPALAQTAAIQRYCDQGATQASVSGLKSTNYQQGIIPSCTVTVYLTGTTNLATIYSDNANTPLNNPFTANAIGSASPGAYTFWSTTAQGYDIVLSGGIPPNTYSIPVTITNVFPCGSGESCIISGGGGGSGNFDNDIFLDPEGLLENGGTLDAQYGVFTWADSNGGSVGMPNGLGYAPTICASLNVSPAGTYCAGIPGDNSADAAARIWGTASPTDFYNPVNFYQYNTNNLKTEGSVTPPAPHKTSFTLQTISGLVGLTTSINNQYRPITQPVTQSGQAISITGNVATVTVANNYTVGQRLSVSGCTTATYFNSTNLVGLTQTLPYVQLTGATSTTIQFPYPNLNAPVSIASDTCAFTPSNPWILSGTWQPLDVFGGVGYTSGASQGTAYQTGNLLTLSCTTQNAIYRVGTSSGIVAQSILANITTTGGVVTGVTLVNPGIQSPNTTPGIYLTISGGNGDAIVQVNTNPNTYFASSLTIIQGGTGYSNNASASTYSNNVLNSTILTPIQLGIGCPNTAGFSLTMSCSVGTATSCGQLALFNNIITARALSTSTSGSMSDSGIFVGDGGDVHLEYMVGSAFGGSFQVFVDGSGTPLTDMNTGNSTIVESYAGTDGYSYAPANYSSHQTVQDAHFVVAPNATHTFNIVSTNTGGNVTGIEALIVPPSTRQGGINVPNVTAGGAIPLQNNGQPSCGLTLPLSCTSLYSNWLEAIVAGLHPQGFRAKFYSNLNVNTVSGFYDTSPLNTLVNNQVGNSSNGLHMSSLGHATVAGNATQVAKAIPAPPTTVMATGGLVTSSRPSIGFSSGLFSATAFTGGTQYGSVFNNTLMAYSPTMNPFRVCQYTPAPFLDPTQETSPLFCRFEFDNTFNSFNILPTSQASHGSSVSSTNEAIENSVWNSGVYVVSTTQGTGYSGTGTVTFSGGTCSSMPIGTAALNGSGIFFRLKTTGICTVLPTVSVTGFTGGSGFTIVLGLATATPILSQTPGLGYSGSGTAAVTGGTCAIPPTLSAALSGSGVVVAETNSPSCTVPPTGATLSGFTGGSGFSATFSIPNATAIGKFTLSTSNTAGNEFLLIDAPTSGISNGASIVYLEGNYGDGFQFKMGGSTNNVLTLDDTSLPNSVTWLPNGIPGTPMVGVSTTPIVSASCLGTNSSGQVILGTCSGTPGVSSINGVTGAFTFSGGGVTCTATACVFSGSGGAVSSVFGRTGTVVAATNDYSFAQLSGNPTVAQIAAAGTLTNNISGVAATASALDHLPTSCPAGQAPIGILANGNATGCAAIGGGGGGGTPGGTTGQSQINLGGSVFSGSDPSNCLGFSNVAACVAGSDAALIPTGDTGAFAQNNSQTAIASCYVDQTANTVHFTPLSYGIGYAPSTTYSVTFPSGLPAGASLGTVVGNSNSSGQITGYTVTGANSGFNVNSANNTLCPITAITVASPTAAPAPTVIAANFNEGMTTQNPVVRLDDFGCHHDGTTDDTQCFNNAAAYVTNNGANAGTVQATSGQTYLFSSVTGTYVGGRDNGTAPIAASLAITVAGGNLTGCTVTTPGQFLVTAPITVPSGDTGGTITPVVNGTSHTVTSCAASGATLATSNFTALAGQTCSGTNCSNLTPIANKIGFSGQLQNNLTVVGNGATFLGGFPFETPGGAGIHITAWSVSGTTATFTYSSSLTLTSGENLILEGFPTTTAFNGQPVTVNSGVTSSSFSATIAGVTGSATEVGEASLYTNAYPYVAMLGSPNAATNVTIQGITFVNGFICAGNVGGANTITNNTFESCGIVAQGDNVQGLTFGQSGSFESRNQVEAGLFLGGNWLGRAPSTGLESNQDVQGNNIFDGAALSNFQFYYSLGSTLAKQNEMRQGLDCWADQNFAMVEYAGIVNSEGCLPSTVRMTDQDIAALPVRDFMWRGVFGVGAGLYTMYGRPTVGVQISNMDNESDPNYSIVAGPVNTLMQIDFVGEEGQGLCADQVTLYGAPTCPNPFEPQNPELASTILVTESNNARIPNRYSFIETGGTVAENISAPWQNLPTISSSAFGFTTFGSVQSTPSGITGKNPFQTSGGYSSFAKGSLAPTFQLDGSRLQNGSQFVTQPFYYYTAGQFLGKFWATRDVSDLFDPTQGQPATMIMAAGPSVNSAVAMNGLRVSPTLPQGGNISGITVATAGTQYPVNVPVMCSIAPSPLNTPGSTTSFYLPDCLGVPNATGGVANASSTRLGVGYTSAPSIVVAPPGAATFSCTAVSGVPSACTVMNSGIGITSCSTAPANFSGSGASYTPTCVGGQATTLTVASGTAYPNYWLVFVGTNGGTQATMTATVSGIDPQAQIEHFEKCVFELNAGGTVAANSSTTLTLTAPTCSNLVYNGAGNMKTDALLVKGSPGVSGNGNLLLEAWPTGTGGALALKLTNVTTSTVGYGAGPWFLFALGSDTDGDVTTPSAVTPSSSNVSPYLPTGNTTSTSLVNHYGVTASGTNSIIATKQRIDVASFATGDICSDIAAAITLTGGSQAILDATGYISTQTCASNPFAGLSNTGASAALWLYMPTQRINTTAGWVIPWIQDVHIIGGGEGGLSVLAAASSGYPANTPLITVGVSTHLVFEDMIEDWRLDCSPTASANCQAYVSFGINEQAGMRRMAIVGQNSATATVPPVVIGDTVSGSAPGHFDFENVSIDKVGANDFIDVFADGGAMSHIDGITCNNTLFVTGLVCLHFKDSFGSGHSMNAGTSTNIHGEGLTTTIEYDTATFGGVNGADCTGVCSNVLVVNTVQGVMATNLNSVSSGTNIVNNTNTQAVGTLIIADTTTPNVQWYAQTSASGSVNHTSAYYLGSLVADQMATNGTGAGLVSSATFQGATLYSAAGTPVPTCNTGAKGLFLIVSDATSPTYLGTYTPGGAVLSPAICNGTTWETY